MLDSWHNLSPDFKYKYVRLWWEKLRNWLGRTKGVLSFSIGILLSVYGWSLTDASTVTIFQRAGLTVQLGAVAILAYRLGVLQKHFDVTPWWRKPWAWIQDFPTRGKPEPQIAHGQPATMEITAGTGTVERSQETLEEKVERLDSQLQGLRERLEDTKSELLEKHEGLKEEFETYKERQSATLERFRTSLEKVTLGDLWMEGVALGWLFVGPLMTAEPSFVAQFLSFLPNL